MFIARYSVDSVRTQTRKHNDMSVTKPTFAEQTNIGCLTSSNPVPENNILVIMVIFTYSLLYRRLISLSRRSAMEILEMRALVC